MTHFVLLTLLALLLMGGLAYALWLRDRSRGETSEPVVAASGDCTTCSGNDARCARDCLLEAAVNPIEYFDDEELDRFAGREADAYTDDEADQFAYVLHTMRPDEVAAWSRSLTLRGISLPSQLRDEAILLMEP